MPDDRQADDQALADLLADPEIWAVWEEEIWEAFKGSAAQLRASTGQKCAVGTHMVPISK